MARGPGYCPRCGERVSPFAAGCALCGADLDPRRHEPSRLSRVSAPQISSSRVVFVVVLALLTLLAPILAVLLCGWIAYDRDRNGESAERNIALAFAIAAFLMAVSPAARFGVLQTLGLV